jgi:hypothetical protein
MCRAHIELVDAGLGDGSPLLGDETRIIDHELI